MSGFAISGTKGNAIAAGRQVDTLLGSVDKTKALEVLKGIQTELKAHTGTLKILHTSDGKKDLKFKSGMNFMWITRRDSKMTLTAQFVTKLAEKACEGLPAERRDEVMTHLNSYLTANDNRIKSVDALITLITAPPEEQGAREPLIRQQSELLDLNPHGQLQAPERENLSSLAKPVDELLSGARASGSLSEQASSRPLSGESIPSQAKPVPELGDQHDPSAAAQQRPSLSKASLSSHGSFVSQRGDRPSGVLREPSVDLAQRRARERSSESASLFRNSAYLESDSDENEYLGSRESIRSEFAGNRQSFDLDAISDNDLHLLGKNVNENDDDDEADFSLDDSRVVIDVRLEIIQRLENEKIDKIINELYEIEGKIEQVNGRFFDLADKVDEIIFTQTDLIAEYKNHPNDRNAINIKLNDLHGHLKALGFSESNAFGDCRSDYEELKTSLDRHLAAVREMQNPPSELLEDIAYLQSEINGQQDALDTSQGHALDSIESPDRPGIQFDEAAAVIMANKSDVEGFKSDAVKISKYVAAHLSTQDNFIKNTADSAAKLAATHGDLRTDLNDIKDLLDRCASAVASIVLLRDKIIPEENPNPNPDQMAALNSLIKAFDEISAQNTELRQSIEFKNLAVSAEAIDNIDLKPSEQVGSALSKLLGGNLYSNLPSKFNDATDYLYEILKILESPGSSATTSEKTTVLRLLNEYSALAEHERVALSRSDEIADKRHLLKSLDWKQKLSQAKQKLESIENRTSKIEAAFIKESAIHQANRSALAGIGDGEAADNYYKENKGAIDRSRIKVETLILYVDAARARVATATAAHKALEISEPKRELSVNEEKNSASRNKVDFAAQELTKRFHAQGIANN